MRLSVSYAGNDHRLGGHEAPPGVLSIFLGSELENILEDIMAGASPEDRPRTKLNIGASVLPELRCDTTDRNRTSPFAFTGNKFEFRMPGSSCSIACPNMIMNTIVAEALSQFADALEGSRDFQSDLNKLIHDTLLKHHRILFSGNNYSEEWREEARRRGLSDFSNTVEVTPHYTDEKNIRLFEKHRVLSATEIASRQEVLLENYSKTLNVEALTMIDLTERDIIPAVLSYQSELLKEYNRKKESGLKLSAKPEEELLQKIADFTEKAYLRVEKLKEDVEKSKSITETLPAAKFARNTLFEDMASLREAVDTLETLVATDFWPFPSYGEMLYSVK